MPTPTEAANVIENIGGRSIHNHNGQDQILNEDGVAIATIQGEGGRLTISALPEAPEGSSFQGRMYIRNVDGGLGAVTEELGQRRTVTPIQYRAEEDFSPTP